MLVAHAAVFSIAAVAYYIYYLHTLHGITDLDGNPLGRDFIAFRTAGLMLRHAGAANLYAPAAFASAVQDLFGAPIPGLEWKYPPCFLLFVWPLGWGTYAQAYALWSALNLGAFLFAAFWRQPMEGTWRWALLTSPVVLLCLFVGQNGLLFAALLIGGMRLMERFPVWAGVMFGMIAFKPHLALCLPVVLLALRQYRVCMAAALTVAAFASVSVLAFGMQPWQAYLGAGASGAEILHHPLGRMISMLAGAAQWVPLPYALTLQACVSAAVLVMLWRNLARERHAHWTQWLRYIAPALYLVTPYGFVYDLCVLPAAWILWVACMPGNRLNPWDAAVWLALWYAPLFNHYFYVSGIPAIQALLAAAFVSVSLCTRATAASHSR